MAQSNDSLLLQHRQYMRDYRASSAGSAKEFARRKTHWAISSGKLVRAPCENCSNENSEAHHRDYEKPLEVTWLCKPCHAIEHRKTRCFRGHELAGDNLVFMNGKRHSCRACKAIQAHKRYLAKKARQNDQRSVERAEK